MEGGTLDTGSERQKSTIILLFMKLNKRWSEVTQSRPTLCDPMDCSPLGSSIHGILQARILEWVAISFSRGSSRPRDWIQTFHIAGRCFNLWVTREALIRGIYAMAAHSSTLAWKIPWTEEPGALQSMGWLRVGHDWATSLSHFTFIHWEEEMATHSSVLAWRIPGTGEPGRLPSVGSHRVGHD